MHGLSLEVFSVEFDVLRSKLDTHVRAVRLWLAELTV